jgi:hypothetical protein
MEELTPQQIGGSMGGQSLPPPPIGVKGLTPQQIQQMGGSIGYNDMSNLPPPPSGVKGLTPEEISSMGGTADAPKVDTNKSVSLLGGLSTGYAETPLQSAGGVATGFVKGAAKTAIGTAQTLQNIGKSSLGWLTGKTPTGLSSLDTSTPEGAGVEEMIQPKTESEKTGAGLETVGELAAGFIGDVGKVRTGATAAKEAITEKVLPAIESKVSKSKLLLGKEGVKTLEKISNPEAKAFVPTEQGGLGQTFSQVVDTTQKAITKFEANSKNAFNAIIDKIPKTQVDLQDLTTRVNDALARGVTNLFDKTMGVTPQELGVNTIDDLKGRVSDEEFKTLKTISKTIEDWPNKTAEGLVKLRRNLAGMWKEGSDASNRAIQGINIELKNIISESIPDVNVKKAYQTATENIDKAEEFSKNLMGKDVVSGESKLSSMARNLKNPAAGGEKLNLVKQLEQATGEKILSKLKGYSDYLDLLKQDFPTKGDVFKTGAKRVGGAFGIGGGLELLREKMFGR